jgi:hypothetical protein
MIGQIAGVAKVDIDAVAAMQHERRRRDGA